MGDPRNRSVVLAIVVAVFLMCGGACCVGSLLGGSSFLNTFNAVYTEGMNSPAAQNEWAAYQSGITVFFGLVGATLSAAIPLAVGATVGCVLGLIPAAILLAIVFIRANRAVPQP